MNKDDLWIVEHFSELVTKYPGKAIAVTNQELVAVGDSEVEVELIAKEKYPDKIPSVLTVPREEDMACLLQNFRIHNILGRKGIFDQFQVCFNDHTRKLTFQKI